MNDNMETVAVIKPKRYIKKVSKERVSKDLSRALSNTLEMAEAGKGQLNIEILPIEKIELDVDNPRELSLTKEDALHGVSSHDEQKFKKEQEKQELEGLVDSIKKYGIINPITVYRIDDGYKLIAGERRTLSAILAEEKFIPAKIIQDDVSHLDKSVLQWIENIERKDLTLWEKIRNLQKIVNASNIEVTGVQLKEILKCEKTQAYAYASLLNNLNPTLERLIKDGVITSIKAANQVSNLEDEELKKFIKQESNAVNNDIKIQSKLKRKKTGRKAQKISINTNSIKVAKHLSDSFKGNTALKDIMGMVDDPSWTDISDVNRYFAEIIVLIEKVK